MDDDGLNLAFARARWREPRGLQAADVCVSCALAHFAASLARLAGVVSDFVDRRRRELGAGAGASFTGAAFAGEISIWFALGVLLAGAMSLLAASFVLRRGRSISESADSLSTGALVLTVMSAFLAIHHLMSGEQAAVPLSGFVRFSLYTLVLMVAGFSVLPSGEKPAGLLASTRGHLMLGAGLFGALYSILFWNPWWGLFNTPIQAAPIFNEMALAYAAPGLLALCTAGRFYHRNRGVARWYAIAGGLFGVVWLVLEIRHAFHGVEMRSAPIGLLEGNCYALAALALALFESWLARIRQKGAEIVGPLTDDLRQASAAISITALAIALWLVLACFNPIWGAVETTILDAPNAIGLIFVQVIAAALAYGLARARAPTSTSRYIAVLTALLFVLIAGLSVIRITHHAFPVDARAALFGLEGLWYALWPMALTTCVAWMLALRFVSTMPGTIAHMTRQYVGVGLWLALAWMMWGLCVLFSPWWGPYPIALASTASALFALGAYLFAAWLTVISARWPIAAEHALYARLALLACVLDLFITLTLVVRYLFRGPEMTPALREASLETWTYSAAWALFSAVVLWVGTARKNAVLRWAGLGLLLMTTAKVFLLDMARLDGVIRAASFLGLGGVLVLVALAVRRNSQRQNSQTEA
ncbi:MAG: DUF2339 domain-containing protein [Hyphomonadaceae bacterium JAD_PAG50586_4]|nr:MAG: DUF2339 domain-containing protein [Hyphomonadaceae bacterium JAD_PAG50586_4]